MPIIGLLLALFLAFPAFAQTSPCTWVNPNTTLALTGPDGVCEQVTNNNPTYQLCALNLGTAAEWQSFYNYPGSATLASCGCSSQGVTWGSCSGTVGVLSSGGSSSVTNSASGFTGSVTETCTAGVLSQSGPTCTAVPTCSGVTVGGFCWYGAANNQSCTSFCASHGGTNDSAILNYAGSAGTGANCVAVATAVFSSLGTIGTLNDNAKGSASQGIGCAVIAGTFGATHFYTPIRFITPATVSTAAFNGDTRVCACSN